MRHKPVGEATEEEITRGLHSRDTALVATLIEEHGGRLLRYLLFLTGDRATAEDIFQETWVRVLERGYQYKGAFGFQAWLLSIARHLVIDQSRHKRPLSLEDLSCDGAGSVRQQVHDGDTIVVRAIGNFGVRFLGVDAPEISFTLPGDRTFRGLSDPRWEYFPAKPFDEEFPLKGLF